MKKVLIAYYSRTGNTEQMAKYIAPLIPDEATLPRDAFVLRWALTPEGAPDGTRYSVEATSERLDPLVEAHGLDQGEFRVPAPSLEGLDSGATVFWQVVALLPDGERIASPTFVARVDKRPVDPVFGQHDQRGVDRVAFGNAPEVQPHPGPFEAD